MVWFGDFDAGEKLARKAISMKDYPDARESLVASPSTWPVGASQARGCRSGARRQRLYKAALANDPGARHIPTCALGSPGLRAVREAIESARAPGAATTC